MVAEKPTPPSIPSSVDTLGSTDRQTRRQFLYERQEKLLHDELTRQDRERKTKLDHFERERQKALEKAREVANERAALRQKETAELQNQKIATQEHAHLERVAAERRKIQLEKKVQLHAEEIVNSVVREHILAISSNVVAVTFHKRSVLRRLGRIGKRSVRRKQVALEKLAQARISRTLVDRALAELDAGDKKPRRRSQRVRPLETEEEFDELLVKV